MHTSWMWVQIVPDNRAIAGEHQQARPGRQKRTSSGLLEGAKASLSSLDAQRLVVTGKDRPGEVVEPLPTDGALILLSFRLGFVVPLFRDLGRVAVEAGHPLGPTHRSDGLKAPGIVNEVQDVQHPCTHHPS